jgi:hypothetical protein
MTTTEVGPEWSVTRAGRGGRDMLNALLRVSVAAACVVAVAASVADAARDALTGVWVAVDTAGDGSTDRFIFSSPDSSGVRTFTLVDSYGSFCETDGVDGTGAPLTGRGTAMLTGDVVHTSITSYVCGNGDHGTFEPPLGGDATLTADGLDNGYYVAVHVGDK